MCEWNAHQISKVNPLKRELILYLILLAALSPSFYLRLFSATPRPPSVAPLHSPSSSCTLIFKTFFFFFKRKWRQQEFSLSSCRKEKVAAWNSMCACAFVRWLEESWLCRLRFFSSVSFLLPPFGENLWQLRFDFAACQKSSLFVHDAGEWQWMGFKDKNEKWEKKERRVRSRRWALPPVFFFLFFCKWERWKIKGEAHSITPGANACYSSGPHCLHTNTRPIRCLQTHSPRSPSPAQSPSLLPFCLHQTYSWEPAQKDTNCLSCCEVAGT